MGSIYLHSVSNIASKIKRILFIGILYYNITYWFKNIMRYITMTRLFRGLSLKNDPRRAVISMICFDQIYRSIYSLRFSIAITFTTNIFQSTSANSKLTPYRHLVSCLSLTAFKSKVYQKWFSKIRGGASYNRLLQTKPPPVVTK